MSDDGWGDEEGWEGAESEQAPSGSAGKRVQRVCEFIAINYDYLRWRMDSD